MLRLWCLATLVYLAVGLELKAQLQDHWKKFKSVHAKNYDQGEETKRKDIFKKNVELILQHNLQADLGETSFKLGINQFADMTEEEIVKHHMGLASEPAGSEYDVEDTLESRQDYPETVDWRESGFVTTPKQQGSCGSCWAFATAAVMETHYGLAKKERVELSEQMLLDCAINGGCEKGGTVIGGFYYIMGHGINKRECYPYQAKKADKCQYNSTCVAATMTDHKMVRKGDENAMLKIVATKGPVAVTMYAHPRLLSLYRGGMYNPPSCTEPQNHAVVIEGYGTDDGQPYWLIRNSWGETWGDKGYFKLPRNANNKCGIAETVRYPII